MYKLNLSPLCTVISSRARSDLAAYWLACQTLEPEDLGRFPDGHLLNIVFLHFSVIMLNYFNKVILNINDKKSPLNVLY